LGCAGYGMAVIGLGRHRGSWNLDDCSSGGVWWDLFGGNPRGLFLRLFACVAWLVLSTHRTAIILYKYLGATSIIG
jgi:hypothetical protein